MYYFIVNPSSSSGRGLQVWQKAKRILDQSGIPYQVHMLKGPGDAARTARKLSSGADDASTVIIVGGDGTINEFLSGLERCDRIRLCAMPTGSGNDFVRGMKLPTAPDAFVQMLSGPEHLIPVDIGMVADADHHTPFIVSSGIGYDAAACYEAQNAPLKSALNRIHMGKLVYLLCALKILFTIKRFQIRITADNGETLIFSKAYFAAAMNNVYQGGGIPFCPDADPTDGQLDLIVAEGISRLRVLMTLAKAMKGKHIGCKGIHTLRCRSARIECDSPQCVHMDGEHFGFCKKITWSLREQKLQVLIS